MGTKCQSQLGSVTYSTSMHRGDKRIKSNKKYSPNVRWFVMPMATVVSTNINGWVVNNGTSKNLVLFW